MTDKIHTNTLATSAPIRVDYFLIPVSNWLLFSLINDIQKVLRNGGVLIEVI